MSQIAETLPILADRAGRFFKRDSLRSIELDDIALAPLHKVGRVFVIGGAIRDLAIFGAMDRPISDIDLVVTGRAAGVDSFARSIGAIGNRFGGYQLKTKGLKIDFWPMSRTWAKTAGHVRVQHPHHLLRCTFFDWDSVLYEISTGKIIADRSYLNLLRSRRIDINLRPNPSELGSLVRGLRRIALYDALPGPNLRRFIDEFTKKYSWLDIAEAERGAFHIHFLSNFSSYEDFHYAAFEKRILQHIGTHAHRQLELDIFGD